MPASHVYVRHLSDPEGRDDVTRLLDPIPADRRKIPGGWWPPLMLAPGWVTENHRRFDVFHVHFGFDAVGPDVLTDVLLELKMHDKPFVYTVHDLRNPHHPDPQAHDLQQDVLVAAADELITLTDGAARKIQQRWNRTARVLPHPHVLDRERITEPRSTPREFVVGVHVKSLRANMDPFPVLHTLASAVSELPGAVLQINLHEEIFSPQSHWYAPETGAALLAFDRYESVRVHVHRYFTDTELWDYLSGLSVSVLPYRFGTHSGWQEACYDLGTAVIAPTCGFYADQHPCGNFVFTEGSFDEHSLRSAVQRAHTRWRAGIPSPRADWHERHAERSRLAREHRSIYAQVLR